jgi:hypothetical protein
MQYYSLASQQDEIEVDMALHKQFHSRSVIWKYL